MNDHYAIVVHGGAGALDSAFVDEQRIEGMREGIRAALTAGERELKAGGSAVDAVLASVTSLEDNPIFNAGRGSVLAADRRHYLDAGIMRGSDLACGAVASLSTVKNPILLANEIMRSRKEILIAGEHGDLIARELGIELVDNSYFTTDYRLKRLEHALQRGEMELDHGNTFDEKKGTVGAVALDRKGELISASSTGGMTAKHPGRIGDSSLVGAGLYASHSSAAISCTGVGEIILRHNLAGRVSSLISDGGRSLQEASDYMIHEILPKGSAGLIAIDRFGNVVMPFNSKGMARGMLKAGGTPQVFIGREES